jgi:hypothetical protein
MRNKCKALNGDLYHANLILNSNCLCGHHNENAEHYCNRFTVNRIIMLFEINQLNLIEIQVNIDLLSFGNKGNNKITELRTIFQRESQNS